MSSNNGGPVITTNTNQKLIVQTQALIDRSFIASLPEKGYIKTQILHIEDVYYVSGTDIDFPIHTFEKSGEFLRIRNGQAELHTISLNHTQNIHRVRIIETLEGDALMSGIKLGKTFEVETVKKKREIWEKDGKSIIIDYYDTNLILEIKMYPNDFSEIDACIANELQIIKDLGITDQQIILDSYLFRKIHYKIKSNPSIKMDLLEKEIANLTKKLREKEMLSGESFKDTGDGWHENPTYETIYHEILALNSMIIDAKEELNSLKKATV